MPQVFLPLSISTPEPLPSVAQFMECRGNSMGTSWTVRCFAAAGTDQANLQQAIQQRLDQLEGCLSHWQSDSELGRFNLAAAGSSITVSEDMAAILDYAIYLARQTGGAYDPAAGQLINRWGFGPPPYHAAPPQAEELAALLALPRWPALQWQRHGRQLLQPGAVWLDFSSIAKGYAVDQLAQLLQQTAIPSYLIELGGELYGKGIKPDLQPWWVELELPPGFAPDGKPPVLRFAACQLAIASSGNYRQYFDYQGQRYGHTLDPRSGLPLQNDLLSVTVAADRCMAADALATALLVMGSEAALTYASENRIAALLMRSGPSGPQILFSPLMREMRDEGC